jgi:hypothetical protein
MMPIFSAGRAAYTFMFAIALSSMLLLSACGGGANEILTQKISQADSRLLALQTALEKDQIRNAAILREYANVMAKQTPELRDLVDSLAKEGTVNGRQYQLLVSRLQEVKKLQKQFGNPNELIPETEGIINGADPSVFNDALVDPINALADMSNGKLARIGVVAKNEEKNFNSTKEYGAGSQLIGNPAYGSWYHSGGTSFWQWYGMYAMFSTLTGGNRVYYNDWNRYRPYSYFNDYGIDHYGSNRYRSRYASSYQKSSSPGRTRPTTSKTYAGARKGSSYSKGSGVTRRMSSSRKASRYSGSLRSSSYSSRSSFGGK